MKHAIKILFAALLMYQVECAGNCYSQTISYKKDGSVEVTGTANFHILTTLNLGLLYSLTKDQLKSGGISVLQAGANGFARLLLYSYNEKDHTKGDLIFGCTNSKAGFRADSWDAKDDYKHWKNGFNKTPVESIAIKFLSQDLNMGGALCSSPPSEYWLTRYKDYAQIALSAAAIGLSGYGSFETQLLNASVEALPYVAMNFFVLAFGVIGFLQVYQLDLPILDHFLFQQAMEKYKARFAKEDESWCVVPNPYPKVLVELQIADAELNHVNIPGIGKILPAQFRSAAGEHIVKSVNNLEEKDYRSIGVQIGTDHFTHDFISDPKTGYPLPEKFLVPKGSQFAGEMFVTMPASGRICMLATPAKMSSIAEEAGIEIKHYDGGPGFVSSKNAASGNEKILPYDFYYIVAQPGATYRFDVDEYGPFLTYTEPAAIGARISRLDSVASGDHKSIKDIRLFPNPAQGYLTVQFNPEETGKVYAISLLDIAGRTLFKKQLSSSQESSVSLNIAGISTGIYLVHLSCANGEVVKKIMVK